MLTPLLFPGLPPRSFLIPLPLFEQFPQPLPRNPTVL